MKMFIYNVVCLEECSSTLLTNELTLRVTASLEKIIKLLASYENRSTLPCSQQPTQG